MIDGVTAAASAAGGAAAATAAAGGNQTIDKQQFLMLFIEQLKHQDPLAPMEPDELTAQLAQLSSLEQLTGINTRLDQLATSTQQQLGNTLLGMLGRDVVYDGDAIALEDGEASPVAYSLPREVTALTATVRDARGAVVRTVQLGAQDVGDHTFVFDGKSSTGAALPDGEYRVELTAKVEGGDQPLAVPTRMHAVVDGVDFTQDPPVLTAGGRTIALDEVLRVQPAGE